MTAVPGGTPEAGAGPVSDLPHGAAPGTPGSAPTRGVLMRVRDLHASYGPVKVLHGLSFDVLNGEVVVILGANGAGKTTLLRALSNMIHWRGETTMLGRSLAKKQPEDVVRLGIAHVPQGRGTISALSVEENLRVGAYARRGGGIAEDLERWYATFPRLKERRRQLAGSLSGGEQQMLAIARGLMSRPKLLMLDEPSLGLAPIITRGLFRQFGGINRTTGTTMLIVEQNASLALDIAHRAYVLETGRIATSGSAEHIRTDEAIRKAYLGY